MEHRNGIWGENGIEDEMIEGLTGTEGRWGKKGAEQSGEKRRRHRFILIIDFITITIFATQNMPHKMPFVICVPTRS